jgi:hypothetical protein
MGERCPTGALVTETKSQKQILHMTMAATRRDEVVVDLDARRMAIATLPELTTTEDAVRCVREVIFRELERVNAADGNRGVIRFLTEIGAQLGAEAARSGGACRLTNLVANVDLSGLAVLSTRT